MFQADSEDPTVRVNPCDETVVGESSFVGHALVTLNAQPLQDLTPIARNMVSLLFKELNGVKLF
jgi:hypothetical protein